MGVSHSRRLLRRAQGHDCVLVLGSSRASSRRREAKATLAAAECPREGWEQILCHPRPHLPRERHAPLACGMCRRAPETRGLWGAPRAWRKTLRM